VTPLILASALDDADLALMLLDAGADVRLEDYMKGNALDWAHSETMLYLLLGATFPPGKASAPRALEYFNSRRPDIPFAGHVHETALARAIARQLGGVPNLSRVSRPRA